MAVVIKFVTSNSLQTLNQMRVFFIALLLLTFFGENIKAQKLKIKKGTIYHGRTAVGKMSGKKKDADEEPLVLSNLQEDHLMDMSIHLYDQDHPGYNIFKWIEVTFKGSDGKLVFMRGNFHTMYKSLLKILYIEGGVLADSKIVPEYKNLIEKYDDAEKLNSDTLNILSQIRKDSIWLTNHSIRRNKKSAIILEYGTDEPEITLTDIANLGSQRVKDKLKDEDGRDWFISQDRKVIGSIKRLKKDKYVFYKGGSLSEGELDNREEVIFAYVGIGNFPTLYTVQDSKDHEVKDKSTNEIGVTEDPRKYLKKIIKRMILQGYL